MGLFGADVARPALRSGLLDDLILHVVPVLLGDGVRLLHDPGRAPVTLHHTGGGDQILNLALTTR